MKKWEVIQIQEQDESDLTGTIINTSYPIAVFSGTSRAKVGDSRSNLEDMVVEQLIPVSSFGKSFAMVSVPDNTVNEVVKIVAKEPRTLVSVSRTD